MTAAELQHFDGLINLMVDDLVREILFENENSPIAFLDGLATGARNEHGQNTAG